MKGTMSALLDRRSFLRRTATITAGAAALVAANGVATGTAQAVSEEPTNTTGLFVQVIVGGKVVGEFQQCTDIGTENEIIETKTATPDGKYAIVKTSCQATIRICTQRQLELSIPAASDVSQDLPCSPSDVNSYSRRQLAPRRQLASISRGRCAAVHPWLARRPRSRLLRAGLLRPIAVQAHHVQDH